MTVNTDADEDNVDGDCSLREAIKAANDNQAVDACPAGSATGEDAIGFDLGSSATTITLDQTLGELDVTDSVGLVIDAANADVTVSGNDTSRVFWIDRGAKAAIEGLTVRDGFDSDGVSGGIFNEGTLDLTDSTVTNNRGTNLGGGIYNYGELILTNSTVSDNEAGSNAGGIVNDGRGGGTTTIRNSTVSGNKAVQNTAGGIMNFSGTIVIENSTITNNSASDGRGGVVSGGSTEVRSSILSDNTVDVSYAGNTNPYSSGGHNLVGSGNAVGAFNATGDQKDVSDPGLGPLADNGGPTETHLPREASPAIDKGNSFGLTTDQRGETRPKDQPSIANASGGDGSDVGAVELESILLELSVSGVIATEGDSGTTNAVFDVSLSEPPVGPVTVDYATEGDTADAPGDYAETSGTLTFAPGDTSEAVAVPVQGDTLDEFAEAFFLNLSNPVGANIADGSAAATIRDDDPTPSLSVDDVSVTEAGSGTTTAGFTVSLSAPSGKLVLADYSTADGTARAADGDYAEASGTLTFRPGVTSRTVSVPVNSDTASEQDEDFFLDLSGAQNATVADVQGEGTIKDAPPSADTTPPTVKGLVATNRTSAGVPGRKTNFKATFSEKMDTDTLTKSTFKLFKCPSTTSTNCTTQVTRATVTPSADGLSATLNPFGKTASLLAKNTRYKAVLTTGVKDLAGNKLGTQEVSYFKTGSS